VIQIPHHEVSAPRIDVVEGSNEVYADPQSIARVWYKFRQIKDIAVKKQGITEQDASQNASDLRSKGMDSRDFLKWYQFRVRGTMVVC
jgi:hypothetical protein